PPKSPRAAGPKYLQPLFGPFPAPPGGVGAYCVNRGRDGVVAGPTARAILDHIFVPQQASSAAADVPQRDSADAQ
ncbi:hypothetical protein B8056_19670, partial [Klebsiella pneumoniae]